MIWEIARCVKTAFIRTYDKIIFLDFDGVMCPMIDNVCADKDRYGRLFNEDCMKQINDIIAITNAQIVITSSWRQYLSLWQLRRMWIKRKMKGEIVGVTPIKSIHRGDEIDAWLSKNRCNNYAIIDDMSERQFNTKHHSHLIVCNGKVGLSRHDAQRIIGILSQE